MNSEKTSIGEIIKYYRKNANISQRDIAKDVCTREYIGKIERNECCPTIEMVNLLSDKLHINLFENYALTLDHHNLETHLQITKLNEAIANRNFKQLHSLIEKYSNLPDFADGIPYQYLKYSESLYYAQELNDYEKAVTCARCGLGLDIPFIYDSQLPVTHLSNSSLLLIQAIAVNLCRLECFDEGYIYFNFLNIYLNNECSKDKFLLNRNKHFELNFLAHSIYNQYIFISDKKGLFKQNCT